MAKAKLNKKETEVVVGGDKVEATNPNSTLNLLSEDTKKALNNIDREEDSKLTDSDENLDEQGVDNNDVTVEVEKPVKAQEKHVKVKLNTDHKCNIGGHWYTFKADVQYNVPSNVKNILQRAGKLAPL